MLETLPPANVARASLPARETADIVGELWTACHVLRDDGLGSHDYVRELTFLLFLKLLEEVGQEASIPPACRWDALVQLPAEGLLDRYRHVLDTLGSSRSDRVRAIYADATTAIRSDVSLRHVIDRLDRSLWYDHRRESLGDAYEGLLERAAAERKSGAGQYFTPRALVESIVALMRPRAGETIIDPACGTGGFLVTAGERLAPALRGQTGRGGFVGVELVRDVARLALMNFAVHGLPGEVRVADSLYEPELELPLADVILTNPPFGTRGTPALRTSDRVPIPTRNKQLGFLQLIVHQLRPGGRAAVVVPDNVLFENGVGEAVRIQLVERCRLHTVLRLPAGIFYATGVKTNVLFFTRRKRDEVPSEDECVWVFDARSGMPVHGKRQPLTREVLAEFELAYGNDPHGRARRVDQGPRGRFRSFPLRDLLIGGLNLDVSWLTSQEVPSDLQRITSEMSAALQAAADALSALEAELSS